MAGNVSDLLLHMTFKNDASRGLRQATSELKALNVAAAGMERPSAAMSARMTQLERQALRSYSKVSQLGREMNSLGNKLSLFVSLPIALFFKSSADAAADFVEQVNKVNVVFGKMAGNIRNQARTAARDLGTSQREYLTYVGTFGAFLLPSVGQARAGALSPQLVKFGVDLASFYNTSTDDALSAIKSGMTGMIRPLRRYGINLSADQVKAEAERTGLYSGSGRLTEQAKVSARASLMMRMGAIANDDYARTANTAANRQRRLTAELDNMKVTVGQQLLPVWRQFLSFGIDVLSMFNALPGPVRGFTIAALALGAALGPLVKIMGTYMQVSAALRINSAVAGGAGLLGRLLGGGGAAAAAAPGSLALSSMSMAAGPSMAVGAGGAAAAGGIGAAGIAGVLAAPLALGWIASKWLDNQDDKRRAARAAAWTQSSVGTYRSDSVKSLEAAAGRIRAEQDKQGGIRDTDRASLERAAREERQSLMGQGKAGGGLEGPAQEALRQAGRNARDATDRYNALGNELGKVGQQLGILRAQQAEMDDEMGYTTAIRERVTAMEDLEKQVAGTANAMKGFNNILDFGSANRSASWSALEYKDKVKKYGSQWWTTYAGADAQSAILKSAAARAQAMAALPDGTPGAIDPSEVYATTKRLAEQQYGQFGLTVNTTEVQLALAELPGAIIDVTLRPHFDWGSVNMHPGLSGWTLVDYLGRKQAEKGERQTVPG